MRAPSLWCPLDTVQGERRDHQVSIFYSRLFLLLMAGHRKSRMRGTVRREKEREGREEEEDIIYNDLADRLERMNEEAQSLFLKVS